MTWRDKAGVTTFYFSRFPEGMMEKDMWRIFQKWGKVQEIDRFGFSPGFPVPQIAHILGTARRP